MPDQPRDPDGEYTWNGPDGPRPAPPARTSPALWIFLLALAVVLVSAGCLLCGGAGVYFTFQDQPRADPQQPVPQQPVPQQPVPQQPVPQQPVPGGQDHGP